MTKNDGLSVTANNRACPALAIAGTTLIFGLGIFIGIECLHKGQSALGFFLILGQVAPKLKLLEAAIAEATANIECAIEKLLSHGNMPGEAVLA